MTKLAQLDFHPKQRIAEDIPGVSFQSKPLSLLTLPTTSYCVLLCYFVALSTVFSKLCTDFCKKTDPLCAH